MGKECSKRRFSYRESRRLVRWAESYARVVNKFSSPPSGCSASGLPIAGTPKWQYIPACNCVWAIECLPADACSPVDCSCPAAGYRNNSNGSLNNVGRNGNYWASSPNSNSNGYRLNFNSNGNVNPANNNNRTNGYSVRCVKAFITISTKISQRI